MTNRVPAHGPNVPLDLAWIALIQRLLLAGSRLSSLRSSGHLNDRHW
jgi:hypothetical protein